MMDKINIMLNNIKNNETKTYRQPIYFNGSEDKFVKSETSEVEKKKMQLISNLINSYKNYEYVVKDLIKEEPWYIGDYCSIAYDFKDGRPIRITAKEYDEDEDETKNILLKNF